MMQSKMVKSVKKTIKQSDSRESNNFRQISLDFKAQKSAYKSPKNQVKSPKKRAESPQKPTGLRGINFNIVDKAVLEVRPSFSAYFENGNNLSDVKYTRSPVITFGKLPK